MGVGCFTATYRQQRLQNRQKDVAVYQRFQISLAPHPSNKNEKTVQAVIIGPCGNGKTCLVNNVCDSLLPQGTSSSSLTRDVTQLQSYSRFNLPFIIYDTPGTTAIFDKISHAVLLRSILTWKKINAVFLLIKYNNRFDELARTIMSEMEILSNYKQLIVILITHLDTEDNPKNAIPLINHTLDNLNITNQVVYFSNTQSSPMLVEHRMYYIAAAMTKTKIQINQQSFMKNFNIKIQRGQEGFFKKTLNKAITEMKEIATIYSQFVESLPNDNQKQAILQDLQISLKRQLFTQILHKFRKQFGKDMIANQYYDAYFTLQKQIIETMQEFQQKIRSQENYKLIKNQGTGLTDIRDLIKKCPNSQCGLIWMRIQQCPNTKCGSRPSCFFDVLKTTFSRYSIVRKGKKIIIKKIEKQKASIKTSERLNWMEKKSKKDKPLGCGQNMDFQTLPRLPNIEEILKQWYNVQTMEEVIDKFQQQKDQQRMRFEIELKSREKFRTFKFKNESNE